MSSYFLMQTGVKPVFYWAGDSENGIAMESSWKLVLE